MTHSFSHSLAHSFSFTRSLTDSLTRPRSLTYWLTHLLTDSVTHSVSHSLAHSFSFTRSLTDSLTRSLTHSLTHAVSHSLARSLTHLLIHSLTHSRTHSLTHSLIILTHLEYFTFPLAPWSYRPRWDGLGDNGFEATPPLLFSTHDRDANNCTRKKGAPGWYGSDCNGYSLFVDNMTWPVQGEDSWFFKIELMCTRAEGFYIDLWCRCWKQVGTGWSPFLIRRTFSSPNMVPTVRRTWFRQFAEHGSDSSTNYTSFLTGL